MSFIYIGISDLDLTLDDRKMKYIYIDEFSPSGGTLRGCVREQVQHAAPYLGVASHDCYIFPVLCQTLLGDMSFPAP